MLLSVACSSCSEDEISLYATLYGVVTDTETNEPVSGVAVTLSPGGRSHTTGSDGAYEFANLDAQQYTITVQKSDYSTNRKTVTAVAAERTEANITLTKVS
ncbi:MAG: carboxypeptidase-like regulatory domain-containing protein [Prevotellaceae bacterium]|nr:carboxypeptidase-like regulatory domain-containing protein [Prevotellaceae bacterium]